MSDAKKTTKTTQPVPAPQKEAAWDDATGVKPEHFDAHLDRAMDEAPPGNHHTVQAAHTALKTGAKALSAGNFHEAQTQAGHAMRHASRLQPQHWDEDNNEPGEDEDHEMHIDSLAHRLGSRAKAMAHPDDKDAQAYFHGSHSDDHPVHDHLSTALYHAEKSGVAAATPHLRAARRAAGDDHTHRGMVAHVTNLITGRKPQIMQKADQGAAEGESRFDAAVARLVTSFR